MCVKVWECQSVGTQSSDFSKMAAPLKVLGVNLKNLKNAAPCQNRRYTISDFSKNGRSSEGSGSEFEELEERCAMPK